MENNLTKQELRALRNADDIVFRFFNGKHTIEPIRRADHSDTGFEQRIEIEVGGSVENLDWHSTAVVTSGFEMVNASQFNKEMRTIVGFLKVGDVLELKWVANNNSENMVRAGLVADELRLEVRRGKKVFYFNLEYSITPANSLARLVRF